ncbi:MAG: hypothetical protein V3T58_07770 [Candidatus Hydrothermarchaeales archaeon]
MQNRYVGDVGDFGKYGLLRALCLPAKRDLGSELSLGVVWYLVPNESHNADGKHTRYLEDTYKKKEFFRRCDPELYDKLKTIVQRDERDITKIREYEVLPKKSVFYEELLTFDDKPLQERIDFRRRWVNEAIEKTNVCNIIFVDPDNGLEVSSVKMHEKKGAKYTFFNELTKYIPRNQSLVIYQHLSRKGAAEIQIRERLTQINDELQPPGEIFVLRYRRGTARVFFVIPSKKDKDIISMRIEYFLSSPWSKHFSRGTSSY